MAKRNQEKESVFAYGFDKAGFQPPEQGSASNWETGSAIISWLPYKDPRRLEEADGVVILQGIFEKISYHRNVLDDMRGESDCDRDLMLEREKQVRNVFDRGGWICFLVGEIIDELPNGSAYGTYQVKDTDLCKKVLLSLDIDRQRASDGFAGCRATRNEFVEYVRQHGIAKTLLNYPGQNSRITELAYASDYPVAVEANAQVFFLPYLTTRKDPTAARELIDLTVKSIISYRRKAVEEAPKWTDSFRFNKEAELAERAGTLQTQLEATCTEFEKWKRYKRILAVSGEQLKADLIHILEDFFELAVDPVDQNREDFKILTQNAKYLGEAKGINGGIKRAHINQVDSHRERAGLGQDIPGILIVNNAMEVESIEQRLSTPVPNEHIVHAHRLNVLVLRTVDLIFLMRHLENDPGRGVKFLEALNLGGGWLQADGDGYRVVSR